MALNELFKVGDLVVKRWDWEHDHKIHTTVGIVLEWKRPKILSLRREAYGVGKVYWTTDAGESYIEICQDIEIGHYD